MRRTAFDKIVSTVGLMLAGILLLGGGLLTSAHNFVNDEVKTQLSQQQIFFPEKGPATADPKIGPYIDKYAGQQLTTGEQAKAFADHYIAVHLEKSTGGKTYSQLSTESRANPTDTALAEQVQTAFRGETLRGLLLNAYAFGKMGTLALYGAWVAFAGAAVLGVLSILGFAHTRRVAPDAEVLVGRQRTREAVTV
ncbi:hypothetical protein [Sporichthya polymorpha]|uniref:hypothetical protein n=1 Tax=Sporichthya polymorpha TaxID=35751 RepID=UPI00037DCFBA|nr:hypothetical protein [Sporichthya polymorpha]